MGILYQCKEVSEYNLTILSLRIYCKENAGCLHFLSLFCDSCCLIYYVGGFIFFSTK